MEITDKDFELADNYLDGTLSVEELALFRIRMQDEEFAGLVHFQKELRSTLNDISGSNKLPVPNNQTSLKQQRFINKARLAESLYSVLWFIVVAGILLTTLLISLLV